MDTTFGEFDTFLVAETYLKTVGIANGNLFELLPLFSINPNILLGRI